MKKSVYSLVLMDDVVDEIDRLAYSMNTSRSNLINQILAEHVSLATPEMRMHDIFRSMEQWMDESFQFLDQPSDAMVSVRSQLKYKYKPTIRYSMELYRTSSDPLGRLKISFRTQSQSLLKALDDFFRIWNALEKHYISRFFPDFSDIQTDGTRYIREIRFPAGRKECSNEELGNAIADYIRMLDSMIKLYFSQIGLPSVQMTALLEDRYRQYLSNDKTVIV